MSNNRKSRTRDSKPARPYQYAADDLKPLTSSDFPSEVSQVDQSRRSALGTLIAILGATVGGAATLSEATGYSVRDAIEHWRDTNASDKVLSSDSVLHEFERSAQAILDQLKGSKSGIFVSKRSITAVVAAIDQAKYSVDVVGINALGPLHQGLEKLTALLVKGGRVSIGLLDPLSSVFAKREEEECKVEGIGECSARLSMEWIASFGILRDLWLRCPTGRLDAWIYGQYPQGSTVIIDGQLIQHNAYSNEAGQISAKKARIARGLMNPLQIYSRGTAPQTFDELTDAVNELRRSGKKLDLSSFDLPRTIVGRIGSVPG